MLEENPANKKKMRQAVKEFSRYIEANQAFIPNYGDRYRHDETISTAFVESTVKYVVSKCFVKKQQMRWTQRGAADPRTGSERRSAGNLRPMVSRDESGGETKVKSCGVEAPAPGLFRSPFTVPVQTGSVVAA